MADRSLASVFVSVIPDTRDTGRLIQRDLSRIDTTKAGHDAGHRFGTGFSSGAKAIISGVGGIVAAAGIGKVLTDSVQGFRAHNQVVAQSNAVIRSTKGAANISAKAMSDYADALERQTKVDGDVILGGENMLATFTQVQNRAGKGNDIFTQSTKTLLDLAAATGTDAPKAAVQLGKALNDPIAGVSALSRVGVTFDAQQKKQIASMQKAGNVAGAQKIVLAELNKEFGGSAKAQGDALGAQGRLTVAWHQAQDTIGAALLPVVNQLEDSLANKLPGAADKAAKAIQVGQFGVEGFIAAFQGEGVTSDGFVGFMERAGDAVRQLNGGLHDKGPIDGYTGKLNTLGLGVRALIASYKDGDVTSDGFVGAMERIGSALGRVRDYLKRVDFKRFGADASATGAAIGRIDFQKVFDQLKSIDTAKIGDGFRVIGVFVGFLADHLDLLAKALPFVVAGFVAYKAAEALGNAAAIASIPIKIAQVGSNIILARSIKSLAAGNIENALATGTATGAETVKLAITNAATASTERGTFATIASATAQKVVAAATKVWAGVQFVLNAVLEANPIGLVIVAVGLLVAGIILAYKHSEKFRAIVNAAFHAVADAGQFMWDKVLKPTFKFVLDAFLSLAGGIVHGAASAFGWVPGLGGKLKDAAKAFDKFRDDVNNALSGVKNKNVTVTAKASVLMGQGLSRSDALATSLHRAAGGPVFGAGSATSDSIPAMLSNGEHVLTAREVKGFGGHSAVAQMRKVAASQAPGFAAGGPVSLKVLTRTLGLDQFRSDVAAVDRFATDLAVGAAKRANATGGFSADLAGVVRYAQSMVGTPYSWGDIDCSGFVSRLVEVAKGQKPDHRLFSTATMAGYPWLNHFGGAFKVGWTTDAGGGIGHTAATVNGVNMESRGGDGVVVGSRSRGANYPYFNRHAFLAKGGPVLPGDPPFDVLDPRGRHFRPGLLEALKNVRTFDVGGWLPPGVSVTHNGTGRPERVRTGAQEDGLRAELQGLRRDLRSLPIAQVDDRYVRRTQRYQATRDPNGW